MTISEKNFDSIFNLFLLLIGAGIIFRIPCTWLLLVFAAFNLFFLKKMKTIKKANGLRLLIALPLLLELLFFFNSDSLINEIKFLEKYASLALFAWFIIGNYQRVRFAKLLEYYAFLTLYIVLLFFFLFIFNNPLLIEKYQNGIDLWEVGYVFSQSLGMHAPGLNMHMAFVTIIFVYLLTLSFTENKGKKRQLLQLTNFVLSLFMVLFINTRMALLNVFLGMLIVFFYAVKNHINVKKMIKISSVSIVISILVLVVFIKNNSYMSYKYKVVTFAHMDKVGKLDEIENPEATVYNSFVTRLSIWKSTWELSLLNLPFGVGALQSKPELIKYYKQTNQHFLASNEFPACNQFLDFFLKYGLLGLIVVFVYIIGIGFLGIDLRQPVIVSFFVLFLTSNLVDDFLLRFDGIVFSGFWYAIFGSYWLQQKVTSGKEQQVL